MAIKKSFLDKFVKATEFAAYGASPYIGKENKTAADLRFGGVLGPFRLPRAAGDFPNAASELTGSTTERCGASSVLQCVRGGFVVDSDAKRRKNSVFGTLAPNGGRH